MNNQVHTNISQKPILETFAKVSIVYKILLLLLLILVSHNVFSQCTGHIALQVLGSGGPIADDNRASSGYLLWVDGKSRLLIDTGAGVFLRFGEAKAQFEDLDAIILTHMHTDHTADLPALLKSSYFSDRTKTLELIGPSGSKDWPSVSEFLQGLINSRTGIYRYLDDFIRKDSGSYQIVSHDVDISVMKPEIVLQNDNYKVYTIRVKHGPLPALAVLIETKQGYRIAISGDQNNDNPQFTELIKEADILIMDHAIPQHAGEIAKRLHATPKHIAEISEQAKVKHLVLSHLMSRSLNYLDESLRLIKEIYKGKVSVSNDLSCYSL